MRRLFMLSGVHRRVAPAPEYPFTASGDLEIPAAGLAEILLQEGDCSAPQVGAVSMPRLCIFAAVTGPTP